LFLKICAVLSCGKVSSRRPGVSFLVLNPDSGVPLGAVYPVAFDVEWTVTLILVFIPSRVVLRARHISIRCPTAIFGILPPNHRIPYRRSDLIGIDIDKHISLVLQLVKSLRIPGIGQVPIRMPTDPFLKLYDCCHCRRGQHDNRYC